MVNKEGKKQTELLWRQEKYKVMYYSQQQYLIIRDLMRNQLDDPIELKRVIEDTYQLTPTKGSRLNSFQHMWGYFKKKCTSSEKQRFLQLCEDVEMNEGTILKMLKMMADKYEVNYLQQSTLLQEKNNCS